MLKIERTNQFKKDYKLAKRRGKKLERLEAIIHSLSLEEPLAARHKLHKLTGELDGYWECHVEPDYLLMCEYVAGSLILVRLGTHSNLF
jgi:mRNA interferase YafQ